ncbi:hypothetical protein [Myroides fluvii]|uniref:hypothetical protein n=1 Tax=Myroides fluvii TaxID=2572594 RepID=UPI00131A6FC0|nr:hypothetical protein [Myroides fluvii]
MNYTYVIQIDYFMPLFFFIGGGAIGYTMELNYLSIVLCAIAIPAVIVLFSYVYADIEIQLDGVQRQLVYTYSRWGKKTTERYPLDELTYDYSSMFTQYGKSAKLHIRHGKNTVFKPRISAHSLHVEQQTHLADCLEKLGVRQW